MRYGSRRTRGKCCRNSSVQLQCVVAVRPSRSPAPASRKEPEHTLVTRRARRAQDWMNCRVLRQPSALRVPSPPATMSVSIDPAGDLERGDRACGIQQLEAGEDQEGNAARHGFGGKGGKNVISDIRVPEDDAADKPGADM